MQNKTLIETLQKHVNSLHKTQTNEQQTLYSPLRGGIFVDTNVCLKVT